MARKNLAERLSRLKHTVPGVRHGLEKGAEGKRLHLPGWEQVHRLVWHRRVEFPAPEWKDFTGPAFFSPGRPQTELSSHGHPKYTPRDFLFFDTETTGLSGGAGNSIFLVGLGRIMEGSFLVDQYFLEDFPGEPTMLKAVVEGYFLENTLVVSYNGKGFDMPLVSSRCVMNRISPPSPAHFDLLYPARRLWRNQLDSCSLGSLEVHILHKPRGQDIPGRDVPSRYFAFLRSKDPRLLELVFSHNLQDIRSLGDLVLHFEYLSTLSPEELISKVYCDLYGMAVLIEGRDPQKAESLLFAAAPRGDWRSLQYLSRKLKREGRWEEAMMLWSEFLEDGSFYVAVERAKYYEHHLKDYGRALQSLSCISRDLRLSRDTQQLLEKRKNRLLRKLEKAGSCDGKS